MTPTEAALHQQCENMAFVLNRCTLLDQWYRKFSNELEAARALLSQPSPASSTAGEVREDRVLLLTSYCGGDTEGCTDERPCDDCLPMCNVCITHGTIDPIGGLDYLRDYPGVETNHRAIRAAQALSLSSGEPASVAVEAVSGEVVDQLKLVNSWLCGLAELDMDEIVADGGITVAMVVQQEAEHQHKRLRSAIAALIANPFDGWQMVPVEITDAMLSATCCDECDDREMRQTWKELLYAAPKPPVSLSKPTPVEAKPWYETDAHRDLSRIIPDMEGKIADAKTRYAHCLPDHLFAPLEASITELRVLRHEVAAQPTPVEAGALRAIAAAVGGIREGTIRLNDGLDEIVRTLSETPPPPSQEGGDGHD